MKFFGLGKDDQSQGGFTIDSGVAKPVVTPESPAASASAVPTQVFDISPLNQRFERMEQSMQQVADLLTYAIQMNQAQQEQAVVDPQVMNTGTEMSAPTPQTVVNPFYEQVMDHGEEAILRNPRIMGRIVQEIEGRLNGVRSADEAQRDLRGTIPEVYDGNNVVGKTRSAIRNQLGSVFQQMGISPGAVDTRLIEELVSYAAVGKHMNELAEMRKVPIQQVPNNAIPFVEGASPGGANPLMASLSDAERYVNDRFGGSVDDYAKTKDQLMKLGILERR